MPWSMVEGLPKLKHTQLLDLGFHYNDTLSHPG